MTPAQQTASISSGANSMGAVHLLLTEGAVAMMAENPEQVMEEIRLRATQVGAVLEDILMEPHGQPRWGLNE
jgi:hypothetical protein